MNRRIYKLPARDAKPAPISVPIITKTTFKILIKKPHIILWDLLYKYNYFFLLLLAQTTIPITIINNGTTVIIANIILFSCSVAV